MKSAHEKIIPAPKLPPLKVCANGHLLVQFYGEKCPACELKKPCPKCGK